MKKFLSFLLCAVLLLASLAGCGKNETASDENSGQNFGEISSEISSSENLEAESEAMSAGGAKPVIISAFTEFEGEQPKIVWKNIAGRKGFSVSVAVKDLKGKTVESKNGITEDGYTIKSKLTEGETYTVGLCYVTPSGKIGSFGGLDRTTLTYIHCAPKSDYYFDGAMPLSTLNNYLSKAITYGIYSEGDSTSGKLNKTLAADAKRAILNTGAKHIARTIADWVPSAQEESGYDDIKNWITDMHKSDPEIIFEACIFETCGPGMNTISIPEWVFEAFHKTPEKRNFDYEKMLHPDGYGKGKWGTDLHVPDISQEETQMFFYYRACVYIKMGFESLHMGQMNLIGNGDVVLFGDKAGSSPSWTKVIGMIREYAKENARRHYVLINGHYPDQNLTSSEDGTMLCDFNSFPIGIGVAADEKDHAASEDNPQRCEVYLRPKLNLSGISPSGWYTAEYPFLYEFDNDGGNKSDHSKKANLWGYDQISYIANQPDAYRRQFIKYTYETVEGYSSASHVALPGRRTAYILEKGKQNYYVMNDSSFYADGFSDEATLKEIFKG